MENFAANFCCLQILFAPRISNQFLASVAKSLGPGVFKILTEIFKFIRKELAHERLKYVVIETGNWFLESQG